MCKQAGGYLAKPGIHLTNSALFSSCSSSADAQITKFIVNNLHIMTKTALSTHLPTLQSVQFVNSMLPATVTCFSKSAAANKH